MSIPHQILSLLNTQEIKDTRSTTLSKIDTNELLGSLNSLSSKNMISYKSHEYFEYKLTEEAEVVLENGSFEVQLFEYIKSKGANKEGDKSVTIAELEEKFGKEIVKIGQGKCFRNKWVEKTSNGLICITEGVKDETREILQKINANQNVDSKTLEEMKKRKLITQLKKVYFSISKAPEFSLEIKSQHTDLTHDLLSQPLSDLSFKPYNYKTKGVSIKSGHLHPLMKVREEFRQIFFELGFSEMPTNQYVDSSFWNFDSLFQPQDHPARDMHDTFFLKSPSTTNLGNKGNLQGFEEYVDRVHKVHEDGGYGSIGYNCKWSKQEAEKLLLRTHTTSVSSFMLYKLAQSKSFF